MTIADKLQLTLSTKTAIKNALITKGAEPTDVFSTYPSIIESLATAGIATPQIIAPMNGAFQVSQQPIITGTLYFSADPDDAHAASTWEFASDSGFTNILHTSGRDTVNLESYDLSAAGYSFPQDAQVYCRVAYESASGIEQVSPIVGFVVGLAVGVVVNGDIVIGQHNGKWILVAPASKRVLRAWGLRGTDTILPNNPMTDPNTSKYNTNVLTSSQYSSINDGYGSVGAPAAEYCRSLGDYDLPNKNVLSFIYQNKSPIDAADESVNGSSTQPTLANIGAMTARDGGNSTSTAWAYSSTENSSDGARVQALSDGRHFGSLKDYERWVLPVRSISV